VALCMGLFVGVGLSWRQEWKNQPLRSPEEISSLLDLPVLGVIPAMAFRRQTPILRGRKVHLQPDSREAEAFRMVRTTLFYQAPSAEVKTILITSPVLGEGKSTVISNLAISIAQAGQTVVVVDADLRRPMQHVLFGIRDQTKGLASVLAGKLSLEQAIQRTNIENLSVLPCGPILDNPAELIGHESFTRIMRQLAERYDRVLVDSPPVAVVTDSQILATRCDTTVLVLRAHKSTRKVSLQAHNTLVNLDARILGVIINDLPLNGDQYGYSGYYRKNGHQRRSRPRVNEDGKHTTPSQPREPLETT
jgi:polysaccharide biosynthesis transport protein